jgi:hypothetical protein
MIKSNIICPKCGGKMIHIFCELFYDHKNGNQFVEVHYNCPLHRQGVPWKIIRYTLNCGGVRSYNNGLDYVEGESRLVDMTNRDSVIMGTDESNLNDEVYN